MHTDSCNDNKWILLKLEREKAPFLEEAPGKLEPQDAETQAGTSQAGKV